jgi:hypothetical protein
MDPKRIGMIVAILAVVGIALYYFVLKEPLACTEIAEQDACVAPCKWDQYFGGNMGRCVDKETALTLLQSVGPSAPVAPAPPAQIDISGIEGLTGRYTAESYSTTQKCGRMRVVTRTMSAWMVL